MTLVSYAEDKDLLQLFNAQCISEPTEASIHRDDLDEVEIPGSTEDDNAAETEKLEGSEHHNTDAVDSVGRRRFNPDSDILLVYTHS